MRVLFLLLLFSNLVVADETQYYQVSFKGLLSAWVPVNIAEGKLTVKDGYDGKRDVRFDMSSQNYSFLETLYALRFCVASEYSPSQQKSFQYRSVQKGARYRELLMDYNWDNMKITQTELGTNVIKVIPDDDILETGMVSEIESEEKEFPKVKVFDLQGKQVLDRLAAVMEIQLADWSKKKEMILPVMVKGEQRLNKAVWLAEEKMNYLGKDIITNKLEVNELETNGEKRFDDPLYVWVEKTKKEGIFQVTLAHTLGDFIITRVPLKNAVVDIESACSSN